jgi:hypothetical protein
MTGFPIAASRLGPRGVPPAIPGRSLAVLAIDRKPGTG